MTSCSMKRGSCCATPNPLEETPRNEIYQKVEKSTQEIQSDTKHHTILLAE